MYMLLANLWQCAAFFKDGWISLFMCVIGFVWLAAAAYVLYSDITDYERNTRQRI